MQDEDIKKEEANYGSLEDTDTAESMRQLWWSIAVILIMLGLMALFYF